MNNPEIQNTNRNPTLDILRGIAIATMILSNFAGEMLKAPHPLWLTILGSLAAPLFVIIAGYLVGYSVINKNYPLSYFLLRGFLTLVMAATIDIFFMEELSFYFC
jgi:peptidoglycan/LPS O-acetylase OafA/YrhL